MRVLSLCSVPCIHRCLVRHGASSRYLTVVSILVRPLTVNMVGVNKPLSVGTTYQLSCESSGSRPAASITWWLGSQKLKHAREVRIEPASLGRWTVLRLAAGGRRRSGAAFSALGGFVSRGGGVD